MERRGGRGGPSRGGSRGRGGSFGDRGFDISSGGGSRGRGFSRGRGTGGRSESRFSRDDRSERPPFEGRGGGRGGPRGRGGFSRDFRGGVRSGDRDFRGGRMERGGRGGRGGKRPASGPLQAGKRPRYEGGSSYPDANGYTAPYQSYDRNPQAPSSYQTQLPYRGGGSGYGAAESAGYGSSGYGGGGYMPPSGYDGAAGEYGGYSAPPPPTVDHYGDSYKSKHYEGSSSGYGQSREYSSQPRSRY